MTQPPPFPLHAFRAACLLSAIPLGATDQGAPSAPPVLIREGVRSLAVAPDGRHVVFPERRSLLMLSRKRADGWTEPEPIPFSREFECGDPCFSPDGRQLFFWSRRPREGRGAGPTDIWVSDATESGWGTPRCLDLAIQGKRGGNVHPAVTAKGDLYFTGRHGTHGKRDIFVARRSASGFGEPENLGAPVNTAEDEFDGFVSPDETTLLFCRGRRNGSDLYVSRRRQGAWTTPRKLGPNVNFGFGPTCPSLSRDGRWLFFTTLGGDGRGPGIYRIDAAVLDGDAASQSLEAAPFAPGRISRFGAFGLTFLPDGRTACFAELHGFLMESRLGAGTWTPPAPLQGTNEGLNQAPAFSPDGRQLFFVSNRPTPGRPPRSALDWAIWTMAREGLGWSAPRRLGNLLDEGRDCFVDSPSRASDGTLYFTGMRDQSSPDSRLYAAGREGSGCAARELEDGLNREGSDQAHVAVSPDGRTLVFSSDRPGGAGGHDLYACRRKAGGGWTSPVNLGPGVNTPGCEASPAISADGGTLYFYSDRDGRPGVYSTPMPVLPKE